MHKCRVSRWQSGRRTRPRSSQNHNFCAEDLRLRCVLWRRGLLRRAVVAIIDQTHLLTRSKTMSLARFSYAALKFARPPPRAPPRHVIVSVLAGPGLQLGHPGEQLNRATISSCSLLDSTALLTQTSSCEGLTPSATTAIINLKCRRRICAYFPCAQPSRCLRTCVAQIDLLAIRFL
jgi:hypothetical protein